MTDTPIIALYYREHDPMKRKMFLDQSIAAGEDEEANAVRKELWELRYGEPQRQFPVHVLMGIWRFGWQWNTARIQRESCLV